MAQPTQSATKHTRYFPLIHFFVLPILLGNFAWKVKVLIDAPGRDTAWAALFALALFGLALGARVMALTVQDRLIRLEETIRMQRLLPAAQQGDISKLTRRQFVALRFCCDAELPDLVRRTVGGELTSQKQIKQAIQTWRPDFLRA